MLFCQLKSGSPYSGNIVPGACQAQLCPDVAHMHIDRLSVSSCSPAPPSAAHKSKPNRFRRLYVSSYHKSADDTNRSPKDSLRRRKKPGAQSASMHGAHQGFCANVILISF